MPIRTYDEVDAYDVYRLAMACFGVPWTAKYVRHRIRKDPRVLDGFGIYAVERGRPVAQVVPLAMPVRLTSGVEAVGALQAVGTLPSLWGRGYARRLMDRAHDMYRRLGMRISTLMTSRNIRGYGIYRRMGYVDLAPFYAASRRLPARRPKPRGIRLRKPSPKDLGQIQEIFQGCARDLYGWTERDPRLLAMKVAWDRTVLDGFRLCVRDATVVGYSRSEASENTLSDEAGFRRADDFRAAIRMLEALEKREFATVGSITTGRDRARYRALGYDLESPTQVTAMALPLKRSLRTRDLPRLFGGPQGRFVLRSTDWF